MDANISIVIRATESPGTPSTAGKTLDMQQLLLLLAAHGDGDEIVAGADERSDAAAATQSPTEPTVTPAASAAEEASESAELACIGRGAFGRRSLLLASRGAARSSALTRPRRESAAAPATTTSAKELAERLRIAARHRGANAFEHLLRHRARLLERIEHDGHAPRLNDRVAQPRG